MPNLPIVVAMTGASGAVYGCRLLEVLLDAGVSVDLTISGAATQVLQQELGRTVDLKQFDLFRLLGEEQRSKWQSEAGLTMVEPGTFQTSNGAQLRYHQHHDYFCGIASGSYRTAGMVICPCSMGTLASIASGLSTNLIQRAADVHLKERRKLVVVPRETPLGSIQLENMKRLADAGAVILPAMPGFYHRPQSISDLVDFVVTRICDQVGIEVKLTPRWGMSASSHGDVGSP